MLKRRLRCGILGIDDVLDRPGSFSEVTGKGTIIDTFIFLNYCGRILSEKVLNKVYPNIAWIYQELLLYLQLAMLCMIDTKFAERLYIICNLNAFNASVLSSWTICISLNWWLVAVCMASLFGKHLNWWCIIFLCEVVKSLNRWL